MITIIGEASRQISKPYQESHPEIPWNLIIGMRNKLMQQCNEGHIYYQDTLNEAGLSESSLWLNEAQFPLNVTNPDKALLYLDLPGGFLQVPE